MSDYWVYNADEQELDATCPACGFNSDDEVEFANHRRDKHHATVFVFADQAAYDVWLEGNAA